jgi:acyl-CoA synthetase (AMP-forming)/AMP-acid ligase II
VGLHDFTFYDLINRNAVSFNKRTAWLEAEEGRTVTYAEVKARVDRLASGLSRIGVGKGDRIAVLAKNSLEYFLLFGAAASLGAIMLPVNWRLSADEISFILKDGEPKILFTDTESGEMIESVKDPFRSVEKHFCLGPDHHDFLRLLESEGDLRNNEVSKEDGFVIIYTAAVGGRPRGALLSHENLLCASMHFDYLMNVTSKDVHLGFLPFFHVGGLFMTASCFHAGALNINMSRFDAVKAVNLIHEKSVSFMMVFSPILASILEEHDKTGKSINSLRAVTGIDTKETIEKYEKTTAGTFWCLYGQTETSCLASFGAYRDRPGAAGKMLPLTQVRLADDYDRPVPFGQVGEITVRGPMVFKGYWGLPEETAYTFREGWHHTGDLGRFDEEGFLWYAGRKAEKELIKPGGENVYPAEVEKAILQHPAIENTVVFGVPDPKWKEGIKAVCTLKQGQSLTEKALIDFVGDRIARYKKPQCVEFVVELPLLADGTVDRAKVKALYGVEQETAGSKH